jgi:hypothetical protein
MNFGRAADKFPVQSVLDPALHQNSNGFVHGVAHDATGQPAVDLGFLAHFPLPVFSSVITVFIRAMSRRTDRICEGRESCPVPFCTRRLNCSFNSPSS